MSRCSHCDRVLPVPQLGGGKHTSKGIGRRATPIARRELGEGFEMLLVASPNYRDPNRIVVEEGDGTGSELFDVPLELARDWLEDYATPEARELFERRIAIGHSKATDAPGRISLIVTTNYAFGLARIEAERLGMPLGVLTAAYMDLGRATVGNWSDIHRRAVVDGVDLSELCVSCPIRVTRLMRRGLDPLHVGL